MLQEKTKVNSNLITELDTKRIATEGQILKSIKDIGSSQENNLNQTLPQLNANIEENIAKNTNDISALNDKTTTNANNLN